MRRDAPHYPAEFSGPQDWNLQAGHASEAWPALDSRRKEDEWLAGQLVINHEVVQQAADAGHPDAIAFMPVIQKIVAQKEVPGLQIAS